MRWGSRSARPALVTAVLTLGGAAAAAALTGCGGPARGGYVAVGAAAPGPERAPAAHAAPQGQVEFQQLGAPPAAGTASASTSGTSPGTPDARTPAGSAPSGSTLPAPGGSAPLPGAPPAGPGSPDTPAPPPEGPGSPAGPGASTPPAPRPGTTPGPPPPPATPARLTLSTPVRAAAADRWCERVTVTFTNAGQSAARSGTVTFSTHIIGALGIDWATITTAQPLPAPLAGGTSKTQTYTVCVESWRVPLGMHVETRKVTATWE